MKSPVKKRSRTLWVFYGLMIYILLSLVFWTYILVESTRSSYLQAERTIFLEYQSLGEDIIEDSAPYQQLTARYHRQLQMIYGESVLFFLLLTFAAWRIHKTFRNEMVLAKQQRNFLLSITHELKSPLSAIRLALETMDHHQLDEAKRKLIIGNALRDTDRLHKLVEDILHAARYDVDKYDFVKSPLDLSALVKEKVVKFQQRFNKSHTIEASIDEEIVIAGDPSSISSLVSNLIENACKYSPVNTPVVVKVNIAENQACLSVCNEGAGIPDREKQNIFQKFYRIGNEDTRQAAGTGLGLFIVYQVVEGHGGKVWVEDNQPSGCCFQVRLPLE